MKQQEPVECRASDDPILLAFEQIFQPMLGSLALGVIEVGASQRAQLPGREPLVR
jgi:hypothetical protein